MSRPSESKIAAGGRRQYLPFGLIALALMAGAPAVFGQSGDGTTAQGDSFTLESLLPASVAQTTDVNAWGWFSYLHDSDRQEKAYGLADVAVGGTERFGDRLAVSADMHLIDDDQKTHGFLEQAFATAKLSEQSGTLLTFGKFNALFGAEPRNEWDRLTGTTSLLFGAEPQDLVGLMVTQPLGNSGVRLRPFLATQFDGHADLHGLPAAGFKLEYEPSQSLRLSFTDWVGKGLEPHESDEYDDGDEGEDSNYPSAASAVGDYALDNWQGPSLQADQGGTLNFADATVKWTPFPDVTVAGEGLLAGTGASAGTLGWSGLLALINYDITDRWRVFARWSYLDDAQGLITGAAQTRHEASGGTGIEVLRGLEIRFEYRHDFSPSGDLDTVSTHLTFSY